MDIFLFFPPLFVERADDVNRRFDERSLQRLNERGLILFNNTNKMHWIYYLEELSPNFFYRWTFWYCQSTIGSAKSFKSTRLVFFKTFIVFPIEIFILAFIVEERLDNRRSDDERSIRRIINEARERLSERERVERIDEVRDNNERRDARRVEQDESRREVRAINYFVENSMWKMCFFISFQIEIWWIGLLMIHILSSNLSDEIISNAVMLADKFGMNPSEEIAVNKNELNPDEK